MLLSQNTYTLKRATKSIYDVSLSPETVTIPADSSGIVTDISVAKTRLFLAVDGKEVLPNYSPDLTYNLLRNGHIEVTGGNEYKAVNITSIVKPNIGEIVTISFDIKSVKNGDLLVYSLGSYRVFEDKQYRFKVTTEYQRYSIKGICTWNGEAQNDYCHLSFFGVYGTGMIPSAKNIVIEKGHKETPSPYIENPNEIIGTLETNNCLAVKSSHYGVDIKSISGESGFVDIPVRYGDYSAVKRLTFTKVKDGKKGEDASLLDWVKDWDTGKTIIGSTTVVTPKIFAGVKNANDTLTGVALGNFPVKSVNGLGVIETTIVNGIKGLYNGVSTFEISSTGRVELGNEKESIVYNPITGKIEFGENVSIAWSSYTDSAIKGLELGARNLLMGSKNKLVFGETGYPSASTVSHITNSEGFLETTIAGTSVGGNNTFRWTQMRDFMAEYPYTLTDYVYSFDYKSNAPSNIYIDLRTNSNGVGGVGVTATFPSSEDKWLCGYFICNWDITDQRFSLSRVGLVRNTEGNYITVRKFKLEKGSKPTDWTPALEDIEKGISDADSKAQSANQLANNTINALGGSLFPKLTQISSAGIYTGTLTAPQVNAVDINASSIKTGTLSADRLQINSIDASKIKSNSITALQIASGSITANEINVANLQSAIITTSYIQGMSLSFTKGTIGGWTMDADSIFRGVKQNLPQTFTTADAYITIGSNGIRGRKWRLDASGEGALAGGNIYWDYSGNVYFSDAVKLIWSSYTDAAIKGLELGARNLFMGSKNKLVFSKTGSPSDSTVSHITNSEGFLETTITATGVGGSNPNRWTQVRDLMVEYPTTRTEYVYSFDYKSNALSEVYIDLRTNESGTGAIPTKSTFSSTEGKWLRGYFICNWNITDQQFSLSRVGLVNNIEGDYITVRKFKFEKGGKPTGWTPALEDVEKGIFDADAKAQSANQLASSAINALGGASYPKLTQITSTGIYTGTLTAGQITVGYISSDRIATGSIHGNKITAGSITADQINTGSLQSSLITTSYIQGLSLNFSKGTIGGWTIDTDSIYRGTKINVSQTFTVSDSHITIGSNGIRGHKWRLDASGEGAIAGGNINWDALGNVYFSNVVKLNWTSYTDDKVIGATNLAEGCSYQGGLILSRDVDLKKGFNNLFVYNNAENNKVLLERVPKPSDCPSTSSHCLKITNIGEAYPGIGGFLAGTPTRANAKFITRIIAKIPIGRSIMFASNAIGDGGVLKWATSQAGTGKYAEYIYIVQCGVSGLFDTTNYFYLNGAIGSSTAPIEWYIASATVYDMTQVEVDYLDYTDTAKQVSLLAASQAQNTADSSVNALGGSSFPKLTQITSNGVYTGSMTADQITSGTIDTNRLNAATIQSNIIHASYLQGLSLNFIKGTIGGWSLSSSAIAKNSVSLGADGSIVNGEKWKFNNDGSGQVANGSIAWTSAGNATLSQNVKISGIAISNAISTDNLKVGSRETASAFEVLTNGTLYAKGSVNDNETMIIDSATQSIVITTPISGGGAWGSGGSGISTINISKSAGGIRISGAGGEVSVVSSSGIFTNSSEQYIYPVSAGLIAKGGIVADVSGYLTADFLGNSFLAGVSGRATNTSPSPAPSFGGYFEKLKTAGLFLGTRVIDTKSTTVTLGNTDTFVVSSTNGANGVVLPIDAYQGMTIIMKQWWTGSMTVQTPANHLIYDDYTPLASVNITGGAMAIFICLGKMYINSEQKVVWSVNKLALQA